MFDAIVRIESRRHKSLGTIALGSHDTFSKALAAGRKFFLESDWNEAAIITVVISDLSGEQAIECHRMNYHVRDMPGIGE